MAEPCVSPAFPHPISFAACQQDSFPQRATKSQPWRTFAGLTVDEKCVGNGRDSPSSLVVACPKNYVWGSSSNGGSW